MIIVGFDQSPKGIGWAHGEPGSVPKHGYRQNHDFGDNECLLFGDVHQWALEFLKSVGADAVYFEQIILRHDNAQVLYDQFSVVMGINAAAFDLGLSKNIYMATIGKWRTEFHHGMRPIKGTKDQSEAWKMMAMKECAARNWWIDADPKIAHNIAEACGIWDYGCKCEDNIYRQRAKRAKRRAEHDADEARRAAL